MSQQPAKYRSRQQLAFHSIFKSLFLVDEKINAEQKQANLNVVQSTTSQVQLKETTTQVQLRAITSHLLISKMTHSLLAKYALLEKQ